MLNKCSIEHITKFSPNWLKTVGFTEKVHWAYVQNTLTLINILKVNTKMYTKNVGLVQVKKFVWNSPISNLMNIISAVLRLLPAAKHAEANWCIFKLFIQMYQKCLE